MLMQRSRIPPTVADDVWAKSLVAFGLDVGNDLGIIVPVTQIDQEREVVYRCYRLGETAFVAGSPLPHVMRDWQRILSRHVDLTRKTVAHGYPAESTMWPIDIGRAKAAFAEGSTTSLDLLLSTVLTAVPGSLVEGWNGVVTQVLGSDAFVADLRPVHDAKPVLAELPRGWLSDAPDEIRPGHRTVWSV